MLCGDIYEKYFVSIIVQIKFEKKNANFVKKAVFQIFKCSIGEENWYLLLNTFLLGKFLWVLLKCLKFDKNSLIVFSIFQKLMLLAFCKDWNHSSVNFHLVAVRKNFPFSGKNFSGRGTNPLALILLSEVQVRLPEKYFSH